MRKEADSIIINYGKSYFDIHFTILINIPRCVKNLVIDLNVLIKFERLDLLPTGVIRVLNCLLHHEMSRKLLSIAKLINYMLMVLCLHDIMHLKTISPI